MVVVRRRSEGLERARILAGSLGNPAPSPHQPHHNHLSLHHHRSMQISCKYSRASSSYRYYPPSTPVVDFQRVRDSLQHKPSHPTTYPITLQSRLHSLGRLWGCINNPPQAPTWTLGCPHCYQWIGRGWRYAARNVRQASGPTTTTHAIEATLLKAKNDENTQASPHEGITTINLAVMG